MCLGHNHRILAPKNNNLRQSLLLHKNLCLSLLLLTELHYSSTVPTEAILCSTLPLLPSSIAFHDESSCPSRRAQQCFPTWKICLLSLQFPLNNYQLYRTIFQLEFDPPDCYLWGRRSNLGMPLAGRGASGLFAPASQAQRTTCRGGTGMGLQANVHHMPSNLSSAKNNDPRLRNKARGWLGTLQCHLEGGVTWFAQQTQGRKFAVLWNWWGVMNFFPDSEAR